MKNKKYPVELFSCVNCTGYMKPIKDGIVIQICDSSGKLYSEKCVKSADCKAIAIKQNYPNEDIELKDLSDWCGETVEKTYYERVEKNFTGVLVGYKKLITKRYLGTDWCDDTYHSYGYCFKTPSEAIDVAVVYYKNNCKRYVRLEDLYNESMGNKKSI